MQPDAGESAGSITRRTDNDAWPKVQALLRDGCTLHRHPISRRYYPHNGVDYVSGTGGMSAAKVRRLERDGEIVHCGVDRYSLPSEAA